MAEVGLAQTLVFVAAITCMRITFVPTKPEIALAERGLDFLDAVIVFQGVTVEVEDIRKEYSEQRIICFHLLAEQIFVVGYTTRGADRHIFCIRKANDRQKLRISPLLDV